jgi:leader peptidase (prepilin peptidase)/N-methyltransferase
VIPPVPVSGPASCTALLAAVSVVEIAPPDLAELTRAAPLLPLLVALLGACFGSFVNVVAWRLPRQESLLHPPSHCPRCGTRLAWYENIPLFGWLLVLGRCRHCRAPVPLRYPMVELLCAGLWVTMLLAQPSAMGTAPEPLLLLAGWLLATWLLPLLLIDLDSMWLPEPLCRWGVVLGLATTTVLGLPQGLETGRALLLQHLVAMAAGLLGFEAVSALAERLIGKPALGLGDAKLAALIGAWLGPTGLGVAVVLAVFSGALVASIGRISGRLGRHQPFPFGPFLIAGTLAVWILGQGFWLHLYGWTFGV